MSEMKCPHCKAAFESSERLLQHFVDSPNCFLGTVSLAGADGRPGNQHLVPSAINPQANQLSASTVTRRTLLFTGSIVVAVSVALSTSVAVVVAAWLNSRGVLQETAKIQAAVQPSHSPHNLHLASVSNSTALTVPPMQSLQMFTPAPPASVANVSTGTVTVSQNADSATNITLSVLPSRPTIRLGESFTLTVDIKGADRGLNTPDLSALPQSDVLFLGQHSNSRSSITIINGHVTRESFAGRVFSYKITPRSHGTYHAGPVRITTAGKTYTHPGVTVEVAEVPGP